MAQYFLAQKFDDKGVHLVSNLFDKIEDAQDQKRRYEEEGVENLTICITLE